MRPIVEVIKDGVIVLVSLIHTDCYWIDTDVTPIHHSILLIRQRCTLINRIKCFPCGFCKHEMKRTKSFLRLSEGRNDKIVKHSFTLRTLTTSYTPLTIRS